MTKVTIIFPEQKLGLVEELLIELTERIAQTEPNSVAHGFLGGEYGYGADFENDTFMMRPECWCDQESCPKCAGEIPNFLHKPTGFEIDWYKYIGRSMKLRGNADPIEIFNNCFQSLPEPPKS